MNTLTVSFLAHAHCAALHVAVGAFTVVAAGHVDALLGAETRSLRALVDVCKKPAVIVTDSNTDDRQASTCEKLTTSHIQRIW